MSSDQIDAKLARLDARVAARAEDVRRELGRVGFLEACDLCREVFGARLVYLKTDRMEQGRDVESIPYNLGLKHEMARTSRKR